jgi:hypothetical protein
MQAISGGIGFCCKLQWGEELHVWVRGSAEAREHLNGVHQTVPELGLLLDPHYLKKGVQKVCLKNRPCVLS